MSTSPDRLTSLEVTSDIGTELFLIGPDLIIRARGVSTLKTRQPSGLYKLKAMRGGNVKEELFELSGSRKKKTILVGDFPTVVPMARDFPEASDRERIEKLAKAKQTRLPGGNAKLLVMSCEYEKAETIGLRGVRLFPWSKRRQRKIDARRVDVIKNARWSAARFSLPAGTWILEIEMKDRTARQAILVCKDWETRVIINRRQRDPRDPSVTDGFEEWIDTSIQMAEIGKPVVYQDHQQTAELARLALAARRRIIVSQSMIQDMLAGKFWNPLMGMTAAHLMLEALERAQSKQQTTVSPSISFDARDVDEVLRNLHKLLAPTRRGKELPAESWPPDLVALFVRAQRAMPSKLVSVAAPPMFAASWSVLRKHANAEGPVWIDRSLWSSIAFAAAWGPYLVWEPQTITPEAYVQLATEDSGSRQHTGAEESALATINERGLRRRGADPDSPESSNDRRPRWSTLSTTEVAARLSLPMTIFEKSRKSSTSVKSKKSQAR